MESLYLESTAVFAYAEAHLEITDTIVNSVVDTLSYIASLATPSPTIDIFTIPNLTNHICRNPIIHNDGN